MQNQMVLTSLVDRRGFLVGAGAAGMALGTGLGAAYTQIAAAPDYTLRIAPLRLELAPGKVIDTFGYNGTVPSPLLRSREGHQVSIDIRNDTDIDDIIHWHGLYVPSASDGAMEEGSPMVQSGGGTGMVLAAMPAGRPWRAGRAVRDRSRGARGCDAGGRRHGGGRATFTE